MEKMYNELKHYGKILADKNHETTEGNYIRMTAYVYNDKYYVVIMVNGCVFAVAEKDDIKDLVM